MFSVARVHLSLALAISVVHEGMYTWKFGVGSASTERYGSDARTHIFPYLLIDLVVKFTINLQTANLVDKRHNNVIKRSNEQWTRPN